MDLVDFQDIAVRQSAGNLHHSGFGAATGVRIKRAPLTFKGLRVSHLTTLQIFGSEKILLMHLKFAAKYSILYSRP